MQENIKNKSYYLSGLTGSRAFAILFVLIAHLQRSLNFTGVESLHSLGTIGVRYFFMLSGLLITYLLQNEYDRNQDISIGKFFTRRILRIFPCFYFYLFILFVLKSFDIIEIDGNSILMATLYLQNFNVFQLTELFSSSWFVKHSWSLSVEEQFYLLFPFLFILFQTNLRKHPILIGVISVIIGTAYRALNYSNPELSRTLLGPIFIHFDYLMVGACLSYIIPRYRDYLSSVLIKKIDLILLIALLISLWSGINEYDSGINFIVASLATMVLGISFLLHLLLFPASKLCRFLETKPLIFIGVLSYSIYVWQQLFLGSHSLWKDYEFVTLFPYNIISIAITALFSYYVIEKVFLKVKKRFSSL